MQFLKLHDSDTGKTYYVSVDKVALIERLDPETHLVTFEVLAPPPPPELRVVRLVGDDAKALLSYIDRNLFVPKGTKGGGL